MILCNDYREFTTDKGYFFIGKYDEMEILLTNGERLEGTVLEISDTLMTVAVRKSSTGIALECVILKTIDSIRSTEEFYNDYSNTYERDSFCRDLKITSMPGYGLKGYEEDRAWNFVYADLEYIVRTSKGVIEGVLIDVSKKYLTLKVQDELKLILLEEIEGLTQIVDMEPSWPLPF